MLCMFLDHIKQYYSTYFSFLSKSINTNLFSIILVKINFKINVGPMKNSGSYVARAVV